MLRLLVLLFIVLSIVLSGYWFVRGEIPIEHRDNSVVRLADNIVEYVHEEISMLLGVNSNDITLNDIKSINAASINKIVYSMRNKKTPAIIYFYNFQCVSCSVSLSDINHISKLYKQDGLVTYAVAISDNKESVVDGINIAVNKLNFEPFIMSKSDVEQISIIMEIYDIEFKEVPAIVFLSKKGEVVSIPVEKMNVGSLSKFISKNIK